MSEVDEMSTQGEARKRIGQIARDMLSERKSFILGSREISALSHTADLRRDQDVIAFVGIDSETDALPVGDAQQYWQPEALAKLEPRIIRAEAWAKEIAFQHCLNLVDRFAQHSSDEKCEANRANSGTHDKDVGSHSGHSGDTWHSGDT